MRSSYRTERRAATRAAGTSIGWRRSWRDDKRLNAEGDLSPIGGETADVIDELETGSGGLTAPYARGVVTVLSVDGAMIYEARAYCAREPARAGRTRSPDILAIWRRARR
jgi:hypothetical protein